jgi:hypothetical protein
MRLATDKRKKTRRTMGPGGFFGAARKSQYQPATASNATLNVALGRITAFTLASSAR